MWVLDVQYTRIQFTASPTPSHSMTWIAFRASFHVFHLLKGRRTSAQVQVQSALARVLREEVRTHVSNQNPNTASSPGNVAQAMHAKWTTQRYRFKTPSDPNCTQSCARNLQRRARERSGSCQVSSTSNVSQQSSEQVEAPHATGHLCGTRKTRRNKKRVTPIRLRLRLISFHVRPTSHSGSVSVPLGPYHQEPTAVCVHLLEVPHSNRTCTAFFPLL